VCSGSPALRCSGQGDGGVVGMALHERDKMRQKLKLFLCTSLQIVTVNARRTCHDNRLPYRYGCLLTVLGKGAVLVLAVLHRLAPIPSPSVVMPGMVRRRWRRRRWRRFTVCSPASVTVGPTAATAP